MTPLPQPYSPSPLPPLYATVQLNVALLSMKHTATGILIMKTLEELANETVRAFVETEDAIENLKG